MSGATQPFGRRFRMEAALRRVQPSEGTLEFCGQLPALPDDKPAGVYTHITDCHAQWAVEHVTRPRARASPE